MAKKITKALIPAAGFGTRFLPQTKAMPKEMMPLVDKPIIQRVVEELVEAGIETIVIVTGWNKRSIEDHFDNNSELEQKLLATGKNAELETVQNVSNMAEFVYLRQKGVIGNATPILNARHILGDDPFMLFWGDDFVDATPSRAQQLMAAYEKYQTPIMGGIKATKESDYKKYGFAGGEEVEPGVIRVNRIIEKPGSPENAPSDLATVSGCVLTADIYEPLLEAQAHLEDGEELHYIMGLERLLDQGVHVVELQNAVYRDTGNKFEYLKTITEYGLSHPEFGAEYLKYLQNLMNKE